MKGVWFWDTFPKWCTAGWWIFFIGFALLTAFSSQSIINVAQANPPLFLTISLLLIFWVFVGNYVPGLPNMFAPLLLGWGIGQGLSWWFLLAGLPIVAAAVAGSLAGFNAGRLGLPFGNVRSSERYKGALNALRTDQNVVLRSRIGKFAAYCGHINIAAGENGMDINEFLRGAMLGHTLWTFYYVAAGFLMGWLLPYVGQIFK
jgi:uncharacterized membrane protein YdjX (TVP38/TMEM64 family)